MNGGYGDYKGRKKKQKNARKKGKGVKNSRKKRIYMGG